MNERGRKRAHWSAMDGPILHIASRPDWESALERGVYVPTGFDEEGFVHCSFPDQVVAVADEFFRGRTDLVLLVIDPARLSAEVRVEPPSPPGASGAAGFPHVYGPIELDAVVDVADLPTGPDGRFALPARLRGER